MKRFYVSIVPIVFISAMLVGCGNYLIKPAEIPMKPGMVSSHIQNKQLLNIAYIKVSEPVRKITYFANGKLCENHRFYVDYNTLSSEAAGLLKKELEKNGVPISADANKKIELVVTNFELEARSLSFVFYVRLSLEAETGDGNIYTFKVNNTGTSFERACGGAITRGVADLLNNTNIIGYVQGTSAEEKDPLKKLEKLEQMRNKGLITEGQYQNKKNEILKSL